jgi:phosphatidate cytidylyltransferase
MSRRVVTAIVLATVGLASIYNVYAFALIVIAVATGSLFELRFLTQKTGQARVLPPAFAATFAYLGLAMFGLLGRYEGVLLGVTVPVVLLWALSGDTRGYLARSGATLLAVCYVGKLLSYFLVIRSQALHGAALTVLVIVLIAFTDIFAMLVGKRFGHTPLAAISPAKTLEGSIGGLLAATIAGGLATLVWPSYHFTVAQGACVGCVTSIAAQLGDLVESALKRDAGMKDAGTALSGHGGVLDRFDSYLFGGAAFYAALIVLDRLPGNFTEYL